MQRLRFWIWWHLAKLPNICPADAYSVIVEKHRRDPRIGWICREDCANTGVCWCGKLRKVGADG